MRKVIVEVTETNFRTYTVFLDPTEHDTKAVEYVREWCAGGSVSLARIRSDHNCETVDTRYQLADEEDAIDGASLDSEERWGEMGRL